MQREDDDTTPAIDGFTTVRDVVERVMEEILEVTAERIIARTGRWSLRRALYRYPSGGRIRIYMTGIPVELHEELAKDIVGALEGKYGDGYVLLPVSRITIDSHVVLGTSLVDMILIEIDRNRMNETRPMPRRRRRFL